MMQGQVKDPNASDVLDFPAYGEITVNKRDGRHEEFDPACIQVAIERAFRAELELKEADILETSVKALIIRGLIEACSGYEGVCSWQDLSDEVVRTLYNGVSPAEIDHAILLTVRSYIEREPAYAFVAARLLLRRVYKQVWGRSVLPYELDKTYRAGLETMVKEGIDYHLLDPKLADFDFEKLVQALVPERDSSFAYIGLQTIFDRYLLHKEERRIETPQYFWMRIAMGLALREGADKNEKAIAFYNILSSFRFVSSTPTLFKKGMTP